MGILENLTSPKLFNRLLNEFYDSDFSIQGAATSVMIVILFSILARLITPVENYDFSLAAIGPHTILLLSLIHI